MSSETSNLSPHSYHPALLSAKNLSHPLSGTMLSNMVATSQLWLFKFKLTYIKSSHPQLYQPHYLYCGTTYAHGYHIQITTGRQEEKNRNGKQKMKYKRAD